MTISGHPDTIRTVGAVTVRAAELVVTGLAGGTSAACAPPTGDVAALAANLGVRTLHPGQVVVAAGRAPDGVWFVRSGAVELHLGNGGNSVVARVLREGDVFGDTPLLIGRVSPYEARAVRATTCFWVAAQDFLRLLAERPALAMLWLRNCAERYADSQARMSGLLDGSLAQRTAALLLAEARAGVVALSQATLAAMIGSPRPSVNRVLRLFRQQGLISVNYGRLRIIDEGRLRRTARTVPLTKSSSAVL